MAPPTRDEPTTPISSADAVSNMRVTLSSWPAPSRLIYCQAVLVFILAIHQGAIREGREGAAIEKR